MHADIACESYMIESAYEPRGCPVIFLVFIR